MTTQVKPKHISAEDLEVAQLYQAEHPQLDRGYLGTLLERDGLGINHHTHSGCANRVEYINLILDRLFPELGQ